jgi:hypothetical protein
MTRRKALTIALTVAGLSGLLFVLLLMSKPVPAISHASYAWKPGCHCGKPATTTTTVKKTTTTVAKTTPTTVKKTTTTAAKTTPTTAKTVTTTATSGTKAATTTTAATTATTKAGAAKSSTKSTAKTAAAAKSSTKKTKRTTTTTGAEGDDQSGTLALGAAVSSFPGGGDGGSSGGGGDSGGGSIETAGLVEAGSGGPPHYYLSPVAIAFLLVYGISFVLYRMKRLKVTTHRKIWNMLLMATFLMCGILGLVLAVLVTRNPPMELPNWLLVWHVETGIAMSFISFFHISWHLRYYLAIVTGKRRNGRTEQAPATGRTPATGRDTSRERVSRPRVPQPILVRSEAERLAAFEERRSSRGGQVRTSRSAGASSEAERWLEDVRRRAVTAS